jgi:DNA-binding MarR family transcriptional regulator
MAGEQPWHQDVVMPALLAAARGVYGTRIRSALQDNGFDDMPRRGTFVLGAVANHGSTLSDAVAGLRTTKQAASQLVDALVSRGYLERAPDPDDRRRVTVTLTDRGRSAAKVTQTAIRAVDQSLAHVVGAEQVATTRAVLGALVESSGDPHFGD